jgi:membrane associated rhomboid family serine protease
MIPYKDDNPTRTFPVVTIGLLSANIVVFILQLISPLTPREIVYAYGAVPNFILTFSTVQPIHPFLTVFTSMFMHGGLLHLVTNMLYLWIFGDNIEDALGHVRFILFYFLCGTAAVYSHAIIDTSSRLPMVGASGAVAGILGAYLLLFPRARVHTLIFFGFFVQTVRLPAVLVLGLWIAIQFIHGTLSAGPVEQGGIAWFAHIGGFICGIAIIKLLFKSRRGHRKRIR